MRLIYFAATVLAFSTAALAQSPYSGMQSRPIKALSEQQIADLRAGRGMGLVLPAELNGYPGPVHVLELADKLGLSTDQKGRVQELFEHMKAEALPLGARLIEQEIALDQLFATHSITPVRLEDATAKIGMTQAELRNTHLKYHLQTIQILSPDQVQQYSVLRGYGSENHMRQHHQMQ